MTETPTKLPLWKLARNEAEQVRREAGLTGRQGAVDVYKICAEFDIRVWSMNLPSGVSGYIEKPDRYSPPTIYVNRNDSEKRQRFTTAHELGHYRERRIAERNGKEDGIYGFVDYRETPRPRNAHELFADEFAGALLMPSKELLALNEADWSEHQLARHFDVSPQAIQVRLSRLNTNPDVCFP